MNEIAQYSKGCPEVDYPRLETLRERLERKRNQAADNLKNIEMAIAFLDKNKGFEEFHDLVGRVGG